MSSDPKGSFLRKKFVRFSRNSLFFVLSVVDDAMEIRAVRKLARVVQTFLILLLLFAIVTFVGLASIYLVQFIPVDFWEGLAGQLAIVAVVLFVMALFIEG